MAFPPIHYCLICEEIRQEQRNLVTLLGFYGVAPEVEILVRDFAQPVTRLAFLFVGGHGEGTFKISMQLSNEGGENVLTTPEAAFLMQATPRRTNIAFGLMGFRLPSPGSYTLQLLVEGQPYYRTRFEVMQGRPEDFGQLVYS